MPTYYKVKKAHYGRVVVETSNAMAQDGICGFAGEDAPYLAGKVVGDERPRGTRKARRRWTFTNAQTHDLIGIIDRHISDVRVYKQNEIRIATELRRKLVAAAASHFEESLKKKSARRRSA